MVTTTDQLTEIQTQLAEWPSLRRWTVEEYHRMGEIGIFRPDERVELIEGVVRIMSPKKSVHCVTVQLANLVFTRQLGTLAGIRIQDPISLDEHSEPEPDLVVVVDPNPEAYLDHHPRPGDVCLVIEVAESSLSYDRNVKALLYARAGIKEYWIINLVERVLELYRNPTPQGYTAKQILPPEATVSPLAFPTIELQVKELLPGQATSNAPKEAAL